MTDDRTAVEAALARPRDSLIVVLDHPAARLLALGGRDGARHVRADDRRVRVDDDRARGMRRGCCCCGRCGRR